MFQQGEVLACDSFKSDSVHFILPIEQRQWAVCDCTVTCEYFFITINYDKEKFQHKIGEFVADTIKEAQKSDLYRYGWKVHRPLCEKIEDASGYFPHSIVITIPVN